MSRLAHSDRPPASEPPPRAYVRDRLGEIAHGVLRVGAGLLFLSHGLQKLFGLFGGEVVPLASRMGLAGVLELVGGALLVLGLFTRPVAIVLAGEMLVAYAIAHLPRSLWPLQNGGEPALLFALIFAFLALAPRWRG
jgi:putative oxidoreductase